MQTQMTGWQPRPLPTALSLIGPGSNPDIDHPSPPAPDRDPVIETPPPAEPTPAPAPVAPPPAEAPAPQVN